MGWAGVIMRALRGLPEHLGQSDHLYGTRRDYIREHLPRSYGGKLVDIANDQQSSSAGHRLYERLHQHDGAHGGLVDNKRVALEWIVVAALESARLGVDFKQPVNGFGLKFRRLAHLIGGPAGC